MSADKKDVVSQNVKGSDSLPEFDGETVQASGDQPAPKIEFPTEYPIKIVGDKDDNFSNDMLDIVHKYDPRVDREKVSFQDSRNGRFRSLRVTIWATGEEQLKELFNALKATGRVHMVL